MALKGRLLAAALGLAGLAGAAQAEPPGPWTGFYLGLHGGLATGIEHGTLGYNDPAFPGVTAADVFASTSRTLKPQGWLGGIQAGYINQTGWLVFGVETDIAHVDATDSIVATSADTLRTWNIHSNVHSLATVRGRLGIAAGPVLFYATAGGAWALVDTSNAVTCVGCPISPWAQGKANESHLGVTGGGGIEWMIHPNWTIRAEYLFTDLGRVNHNFVGTAHSGTTLLSPPDTYDYRTDSLAHDLKMQTGRVGLNFKF